MPEYQELRQYLKYSGTSTSPTLTSTFFLDLLAPIAWLINFLVWQESKDILRIATRSFAAKHKYYQITMAPSILLLLIGILHFAHGLVEYIVYPADKKDTSACAQINDALIKMLGESQVQFYESEVRQTTEFWLIQALEYQKAGVSRIRRVRVPQGILVNHDHNDNF